MSDTLVTAIDAEILKLQQVRGLLVQTGKAGAKAAKLLGNSKPRKKRNLTPEGRARIAEAVKKRWAKQKRAAKRAAKAEAIAPQPK